MRRRRLLALLSATAAGTAGCLGDADPDPGTADPSDGTDTPAGTTTDPTNSGPGDPVGAPPGEAGFPPDDDGVDRVVWAADVDDPSGRVSLDPDVTSNDLPEAAATFTLHNRSGRRFASNFYDWGVYRREGERWHLVAPRFVNQPLMYL